jgi:hypothetical protein
MVVNEEALFAAQKSLLLGRTWRYLRYLHLRHMVMRVQKEVSTICVCGSGHGFAELAIAAEFPAIEFTLTDIINQSPPYPNYHLSMSLAWQHGVDNVRYSIWNVLRPARRRFDMVCSTEMLEHIENDVLASKNMRNAAGKYVYCLVPYADKATNADQRRRADVRERFQHYVAGYDAERLAELFPGEAVIAGAYWADAGQQFRKKLGALSDEEILANVDALKHEAMADVKEQMPSGPRDGLGIRILAKV